MPWESSIPLLATASSELNSISLHTGDVLTSSASYDSRVSPFTGLSGINTLMTRPQGNTLPSTSPLPTPLDFNKGNSPLEQHGESNYNNLDQAQACQSLMLLQTKPTTPPAKSKEKETYRYEKAAHHHNLDESCQFDDQSIATPMASNLTPASRKHSMPKIDIKHYHPTFADSETTTNFENDSDSNELWFQKCNHYISGTKEFDGSELDEIVDMLQKVMKINKSQQSFSMLVKCNQYIDKTKAFDANEAEEIVTLIRKALNFAKSQQFFSKERSELLLKQRQNNESMFQSLPVKGTGKHHVSSQPSQPAKLYHSSFPHLEKLEIDKKQKREQLMGHQNSTFRFDSKVRPNSFRKSIMNSDSNTHISGKQPFKRSDSETKKQFEHVEIGGRLYEIRLAKQQVVENDKPRPSTSYEPLMDRNDHANYMSRQHNEGVKIIDGEMYKKISTPKRTTYKSVPQRALTLSPNTVPGHTRNYMQESYEVGFSQESNRYNSRQENNESGTGSKSTSLQNMNGKRFERVSSKSQASSGLTKN